MLFKKMSLTAAVLCVLLMVTGCWDALDINGRTLVVTVISDKQGDDYAFYIETPNIGKGQYQQNGAGGSGEKYYTIYAKGSTFAEARRQLNAEVDNPIFLGTVKALVITDDLAQYSIEEYMMRMQSDIYYRKALHVITSSTDPAEILALTPQNNVSIGESISDSISSLKTQGKLVLYTVADILEFIYGDACFVLINMEAQNGYIAYNGYSVFKKSKLIDFIPVEEAKGLVWLLGDSVKRIYTTAAIKDCTVTISVDLNSRNVTTYYENGKLVFDVQFKLNSSIMYLSKNIKVDDKLQIKIKDDLQNKIAGEIADEIKHAKGLQCDYLHFKDIFRIKYPNQMKNINWSDTFLNAEFKISVQTDLQFGSLMDFSASGAQVSE